MNIGFSEVVLVVSAVVTIAVIGGLFWVLLSIRNRLPPK